MMRQAPGNSLMSTLSACGVLAWALSGCGRAPVSVSGPGAIEIPDRAPGLTRATEVLGPLVVRSGKFAARSSHLPWSAWWYPAKDPYLFRRSDHSRLSPLEKYDLYMLKVHGVRTRAAEVEADRYERSGRWASDSDGLCHAWSRAAIMEPEPADWMKPAEVNRTISLGGVPFTIGDLKALLVKSYERVDKRALVTFGEPFRQQRGDDPDDLYPDQLHRVLQAQLFEKAQPFYMDDDAGIETWNSPVYRAVLEITNDATDPSVVHVRAALVLAKPVPGPSAQSDGAGDPYEFTNLVGRLAVTKFYTYDLHGYPLSDGGFQVVFGLWTGNSVVDHPDFLTLMPGRDHPVQHVSLNEEIQTEKVLEILEQARLAGWRGPTLF